MMAEVSDPPNVSITVYSVVTTRPQLEFLLDSLDHVQNKHTPVGDVGNSWHLLSNISCSTHCTLPACCVHYVRLLTTYRAVPCRLSLRSPAARLLGLRVQIPLRAWMFVSCVCCVLRR
jgi:hypothetical protein